jgi:hypothetical protein
MLGLTAADAAIYSVIADAAGTAQHLTTTKLKIESIIRDQRSLEVLNSKLVSEIKENGLSTK